VYVLEAFRADGESGRARMARIAVAEPAAQLPRRALDRHRDQFTEIRRTSRRSGQHPPGLQRLPQQLPPAEASSVISLLTAADTDHQAEGLRPAQLPDRPC
jgi:hypothetical protein